MSRYKRKVARFNPDARLSDAAVKALQALSAGIDRFTPQGEYPFVALRIEPYLRKMLIAKDFIVCGIRDEIMHFSLTGRGLRALYRALQSRQVQRVETGGICPTCGIRPLHIQPGGTVKSYCRECLRDYHRKYYRMRRGKTRNPEKMFCSCGKPRHTTKSGRLLAYCLDCHNAKSREAVARSKLDGRN